MHNGLDALPRVKTDPSQLARDEWTLKISGQRTILRGDPVTLESIEASAPITGQVCWFAQTTDHAIAIGCVINEDSAWLAGALPHRLPQNLARATLLSAFVSMWAFVSNALRFGPIDDATTNPGSEIQQFLIRFRSEVSVASVCLYFSCNGLAAARQLIDSVPWPQHVHDRWTHLQKQLLVTFTGPFLNHIELASLNVGDLLIFNVNASDGKDTTVKICCPLRSITPCDAIYMGDHLCLVPAFEPNHIGLPMNNEEVLPLIDSTALRFSTTVELPMLSLSHAQLCALTVDTTLPIQLDLQRVTGRLKVDGQVVAIGRLVQLEGALALEITAVNGTRGGEHEQPDS